MSTRPSNIHPTFENHISRAQKESLLNQRGVVLWFTGLSGSGKSTIAQALEKELFNRGYHIQTLDGDNVRAGLCSNLEFSLEDRQENIRRIAEAARLFKESGLITICSFVSPTRQIRSLAKGIIGSDDFTEVFIDTPLHICESRDVKGLYKKARKGEIINFTGIDSPYESPESSDVRVDTENSTVIQSVELIISYLSKRNQLTNGKSSHQPH